jgi:hypothetical protein
MQSLNESRKRKDLFSTEGPIELTKRKRLDPSSLVPLVIEIIAACLADQMSDILFPFVARIATEYVLGTIKLSLKGFENRQLKYTIEKNLWEILSGRSNINPSPRYSPIPADCIRVIEQYSLGKYDCLLTDPYDLKNILIMANVRNHAEITQAHELYFIEKFK